MFVNDENGVIHSCHFLSIIDRFSSLSFSLCSRVSFLFHHYCYYLYYYFCFSYKDLFWRSVSSSFIQYIQSTTIDDGISSFFFLFLLLEIIIITLSIVWILSHLNKTCILLFIQEFWMLFVQRGREDRERKQEVKNLLMRQTCWNMNRTNQAPILRFFYI